MNRQMKLSMIMEADATRLRSEAASGAGAVDGITAANDRAAASAQRATEATQGQSAAERDLQAAINRRLGIASGGSSGRIDDTFTAARARDVAAYGAELDRLRARYNPLYAEIMRYRAAQAEIRQAHTLGAISATEMVEAMSRERQAALASVAAIKARNAALSDTPAMGGGSRFNTSNLAAQGFDIVSTTGFMPWYTVTLQQGPQVAQVFNDIRANGERIGPAVAGAFSQLVNPISLVTIGAIAAGTALVQWAMAGIDGAASLDEAFQKHEDTLARIEERYSGFITGLTRIRDDAALLAAMARDSVEVMEAVSRRERTSFLDGLIPMREFDQRTGEVRAYVDSLFKPFEEAIRRLDTAAVGSDALATFRREIEQIVATDPENLRQLGDQILLAGQNAFRAASGADQAREAVESLGDAAGRRAEQVVALAGALQMLAGIAVPAMSNTDRAIDIYSKQIEAQRGLSPADALGQLQLLDAGFMPAFQRAESQRLGAMAPTPTRRPNDIEIDNWRFQAEQRGAPGRERQSDFDREIERIRERTAALETEAKVIGMSTFEAEKYAATMRLEHAAREDAIGLTPERIAAIDAETTAYARRKAATEEALQAEKALQAELEFRRELTGSVIDDLRSAADDGKITWAELADVAVNALDRIIDKIQDDLLDALLEVNKAAGDRGGGGFWSNLFGAIGGLFGLGGSSLALPPTAPIPTPRPGFAGGTENAPPGWAWVGEDGPELMRFRGGEKVRDHATSVRMAAAARPVAAAAAAAGNGTVVQIIDQRRSGTIAQERSTGPDGETLVRLIVRDELAAYDSGLPDRVEEINRYPRLRA